MNRSATSSVRNRSIGVGLAVTLLAAPAHAAEKITLESGDTLEVEVIEQTEDVLVVEHPVFGRLEIPRDRIKKEEVEGEEPGLFGSPVLRGWSRSVGLGFGGSSGTSKDANVNAEANITRETDRYRGAFKSQYFFASQNDETSTNEFYGQYSHDLFLFTPRFFISGQVRYDFDDLTKQGWRHRVSGQVAPGWDFIKNDTMELRGSIGVGFAYNVIPAGKDETIPEGVLSLGYRWNVTDGQKFEAGVTYYPNLKDLPEFRMIANAAYTIDLGIMEGLGLKLGVEDEYNSQAHETFTGTKRNENNNLRYYGNLVYSF